MSPRSAYLRKLICKLMYAPRLHTAPYAAATRRCVHKCIISDILHRSFVRRKPLQKYLAIGRRALSARDTPQWSIHRVERCGDDKYPKPWERPLEAASYPSTSPSAGLRPALSVVSLLFDPRATVKIDDDSLLVFGIINMRTPRVLPVFSLRIRDRQFFVLTFLDIWQLISRWFARYLTFAAWLCLVARRKFWFNNDNSLLLLIVLLSLFFYKICFLILFIHYGPYFIILSLLNYLH